MELITKIICIKSIRNNNRQKRLTSTDNKYTKQQVKSSWQKAKKMN